MVTGRDHLLIRKMIRIAVRGAASPYKSADLETRDGHVRERHGHGRLGTTMTEGNLDIRDQLIPLIRAAGVRKTAARAGVHHGTLIGWMQGTRNINVRTLERLTGYLGVVVRIEPCAASIRRRQT